MTLVGPQRVEHPRLTYVGGPTALLEWNGLRLLTDPTFDPPDSTYELPGYVLRKTAGPALSPAELGSIDIVLLSHDHHFDNLDQAGRALLASVGTVVTTVEGAGRLGASAVGLAPWDHLELPRPEGHVLRVTATPARHGPADGDRGPVVGFALSTADRPGVVWFSGDTVLYEGVLEVARRFDVRTAFLNMGAARISAAGGQPLTFTAQEAVAFAQAMPKAMVVPLHFEGWQHYSESRGQIEDAFAHADISERLHWPPLGRPIVLDEPSGESAAGRRQGGRAGHEDEVA